MIGETDALEATADHAVVLQGGTPTREQLVAIVAAVDAVWPGSGTGDEASAPSRPIRWRFSGRWWSKPLPSRRDRPS